MPKDRYRLYHVEKAKGGIALTMTAGSAVVSPDIAGGVRQSARLQGRDRAVDAAAGGRLPRAWRRRDDPAHASRAAHRLEQGGLAAGAGALADPRTGAPGVPQGDRGLGHRPHRRRLCGARRSACRRPDWMASRSTPTAICPTSSGRRRPTSGRMSTAAAWITGCASRSRARCDARRGRARHSSSASAWWPMRTGRSGCPAPKASRSRSASSLRADGFPQHHPRPYRYRCGARDR